MYSSCSNLSSFLILLQFIAIFPLLFFVQYFLTLLTHLRRYFPRLLCTRCFLLPFIILLRRRHLSSLPQPLLPLPDPFTLHRPLLSPHSVPSFSSSSTVAIFFWTYFEDFHVFFVLVPRLRCSPQFCGSEKSRPWAVEVTNSKQGLLYYLQCATLEPRLHRYFHYCCHIYSKFYFSFVSPRCVSCQLSIFCYLLI
jgi:hypothetical protein